MKKYFVTLILLLILTKTHSQSNIVNFHYLDIHGISFNKKVNVLFKDSFGFLWIGCNSGLYKYDGHSLIQYQHDVFSTNSLPNNTINSIIEDSHKNLWIGSESYLIHFNRKENKFTGFLKNSTSIVKSITTDGSIWIELQGSGLLKFKTEKNIQKIKLSRLFNQKTFDNLTATNQKSVSSIIEDNFKRQWFGTNNGILILDNDGVIKSTSFKEKIVNMKLFSNNQVLVTTPQNLYVLGYNKSDCNVEILENYPEILKSYNSTGTLTSSAYNSNNNDLWIGSTNGLLKATRKYNTFNFNYYSNNHQKTNLLNNHITSTIFDTYGNLWIGSYNGINKYIGKDSLFQYHQLSTNNSLTTSIFNQKSNNLLIGTNNGIYKFDVNSKISTKIKSKISNVNIITQNYEKTELLIASHFNIYQSKNFKSNSTELNLVKIKTYKHIIKQITPINKNEIWVGLWSGGIDIINSRQSISKFKKKIIEQLKNNHTSTIILTKENKLWIGTRGEGLYLIDLTKETTKHFLPTLTNGLTSKAILSLHEDKTGNIWIGTRGGGLNMYDKNLAFFKDFKETKTNRPKTVLAIEEGVNGNIWMSTRNGITMLDLTSQRFIPFGIEDGVIENQFVFDSSIKNSVNNIFYFGCTDGFQEVTPKNLITQNTVPTTVITNFSTLGTTLDNKNNKINKANSLNINSGKPIILPYDQNNILINFSSLDFTTPNKNEYAYKLKGLNDYWIYTSAFNRNANYNNLPPSSYTFMVKSSNSDGVWNETPSEVTFIIEPSIWKSTWAIVVYSLFTLLILCIITILIRRWFLLKSNLVKETISREKDNDLIKMKMIFFTDISHELRTPLSLILGTIEKVVKEKKFTLSPLTSQRIYNNTLRMHRLINQIMDIRKFDGGKFKLKISKNNIVTDVSIIKNAFNDFAKIYQIKYEFITAEKEIIGWYDVDLIEKILFNLLSNAFKYTKEQGKITVSLESTKDNITKIGSHKIIGKHIKCCVRDNGIGIPQKDIEFIFDRYYQSTKSRGNQLPGTGIGMELVSKLIERHHGTIMVESEENIYTEFTFYIPISKNKYDKNELLEKGTPLRKNFIKNSEYQVIEKNSSKFEANETNKESNKKPKILIVEDNIELRQMVCEELSSDFTIIQASNGKEGYKSVLNEKPELIISDILMPIQDGITMLKQIKKNPEFKNIPVFMLTAKNSNDSKIECLSLGATDYIEKPFSLEFLNWKVKNSFSTRKELKEKYSKLITTAPVDIQIDSNDEIFIKKIIKIIEDNMDNNILNVEFLSAEIGMSRANLYRKVQLILNDTPVNFIKTIKLKRAAQLLKKNKIYISEVAYMTGFNNQKYFSKCFSKEYGISPTEYIKKHIEAAEINNFSELVI
ncbi:two-component regulator propeller domain-containing protein [Flavicella sp.]|uniref:hybrid sensor histidine kinase/response regulator transcription factor n=1 Tax=Flavicella sp. TaxID=2957742 RepID=UPI003019FE3E